MRITSKGQVTIPIAIRERLGLLPDTEVSFEIHKDAVLLRKNASVGNTRLGPYLARVRGKSGAGLSTAEIMAHTRGGKGDGTS